jgi:hypothetical protein
LENGFRMFAAWIGVHALLGNVVGVVTFGAFESEAAGTGNTIAREVKTFARVWSKVGTEGFLVIEQGKSVVSC